MSNQSAAGLLLDHMDLLTCLDRSLPVLDLACGKGRNGLMLAEQGVSVLFADRSVSALKAVEQHLLEASLPGRVWQVDLEQPNDGLLANKHFAAVLGFNYLYRPLFPILKRAIVSGGLVVYETFTLEQSRFGRPHNPNFLLMPGELKACFQHWEIIHYFEGVRQNPDRGIAQIVARKPNLMPLQPSGTP